MADPRAKDVIQEWELYRSELGTTLSHCQQVSRYLYPDRADFTSERTPGQKRMQYVFDEAPLFAHETGAAGLHAMFTSDSLPWFTTEPDDERLYRDDDVRAWFAAADIADYDTFNSPSRNFASQSHEVYLDWLAFGTAVMFALPSDTSDVFFSTRHLKEVVLIENEEDRIDGIIRHWQWPALKAVRQWGAAAGDKAAKLVADGKGNEKLWFYHRVKKRLDRDPQRADGRNKPYESLYVREDDQGVISESGFDIFPAMAPRLGKIPSEIWGRGRGMLMLPAIKMLNETVKVTLKGAQKRVDPPLFLPDDGYALPIKTTPGSLNYYRAGLRPTDRLFPLETNGDPRLGIELIQMYRMAIKEGFFNNLLLTPTDPTDPASAGKGVTATFTTRQSAENMRALSALNSRGTAEWAAPVVEKVRYYNWQRSVARRFGPGSPYPPPPAALAGVRWHANFRSPIALAQRAAELTAIDQLMQRQVQLRQIDPEAPLIFHDERLLRLEGRDLNVPLEVLKTPRELAQERALNAQMVAEMHRAQVAQTASGAVQNLAGAQAQMRQAA